MKYGLREDELHIIITYIAKHREIETAILFGSRAMGTYRQTSDIDIALKGEQVTPFVAATLKSELEDETVIPYFFDFVSYPQLTHREFIKHIDEYGITIYSRRDGSFE